ncbi:type IX secretion system membrane protein PorP/SprF [Roseivirga pacifica]|uniref:PorP/SprF family type IX secretion system membrane protein n=1 Tax=Roseivirga pacifica TaxID=1267423 RepID=UPI003BB075AB
MRARTKHTFRAISCMLVMLAGSFIAIELQAQQYPQYTQYMYNQMVLNPAYAGSNGYTEIGILGRTQWTNIEGAPRTYSISLNTPVGEMFGIGASVVGDKAGPVNETMTNLALSFSLPVGENSFLAMGINGGLSFLDVNFSELVTIDPNDPILSSDINSTYANFGAGLFFHSERFYVGLSSPNLLRPTRIENNNGMVTKAAEEIHTYLTSGYVFDINSTLKLKPSVLLYYVNGSPLKVDVSANLLFKEQFEFGLTYRPDDTIAAMVGVQVSPNIRLGYAYDYTTTSTFGPFSAGSHELMLLLKLGNYKVKSPRFF